MTRLFGTDGIRGVANVDLRPTLAYALGRATVRRLVPAGGAIVVGQDTRRSGDMLAAALVAGATSMGADVYRAGVLPTPALAFLAGSGRFAAGVMVSASHNPARTTASRSSTSGASSSMTPSRTSWRRSSGAPTS